ncbi:hypothetical protein BKA60DRAFT_580910, partial [Fusarium oxysporum]
SFFPHLILITAIVHLEIDSISTKNLGRGAIISSHIPEIISQAMNDLMEILLIPYLNSLSIHRKDSDSFWSKTLRHS